MAMKYSKTIIWYYGTPGHGKGAVDGMSSFGMKEPMRNAIIQSDWYFSNTSDILRLLMQKFAADIARFTIFTSIMKT